MPTLSDRAPSQKVVLRTRKASNFYQNKLHGFPSIVKTLVAYVWDGDQVAEWDSPHSGSANHKKSSGGTHVRTAHNDIELQS